jgi:hypothetical protein
MPAILGDKVVGALLRCANALSEHNADGDYTELINEARLLANNIDNGL